nr:hypothetical protein [Mycobacterium sp. 852013-51886_SCH5428379]
MTGQGGIAGAQQGEVAQRCDESGRILRGKDHRRFRTRHDLDRIFAKRLYYDADGFHLLDRAIHFRHALDAPFEYHECGAIHSLVEFLHRLNAMKNWQEFDPFAFKQEKLLSAVSCIPERGGVIHFGIGDGRVAPLPFEEMHFVSSV